MKEEIDIVDAHDEIVGKSTRAEAHKKKLLHRNVYVMLFDPDGRLFMQKRASDKEFYANCWEGSLSGHVKSGETYKEAAERELFEELGVCVPPKMIKNIIEFGFHDENERVLITLFAIKDFKGDIKLDEEEVAAGEYWTIKKLEAEMLKGKELVHPAFRKAWDELKASKEKLQEFVKI
jgi:isopentenyl-diphosphate delta-isomerase